MEMNMRVGGGDYWISTEVSNWRTREAWPETILLSVCSIPSFCSSSHPLTHAERTFLAWLRTSLSFASIGIAVTQLFRLNTSLSGVKGANSALSDSSSSSPELLLVQQSQQRDNTVADPHRLRQVGKPLGATFLAIGLYYQ